MCSWSAQHWLMRGLCCAELLDGKGSLIMTVMSSCRGLLSRLRGGRRGDKGSRQAEYRLGPLRQRLGARWCAQRRPGIAPSHQLGRAYAPRQARPKPGPPKPCAPGAGARTWRSPAATCRRRRLAAPFHCSHALHITRGSRSHRACPCGEQRNQQLLHAVKPSSSRQQQAAAGSSRQQQAPAAAAAAASLGQLRPLLALPQSCTGWSTRLATQPGLVNTARAWLQAAAR